MQQPHYGRRVRERRDELGLTRWDLANAAQVAGNYITNITCGLDEPSNRVKHILARLLEAPELKPLPASVPDPPPKQPKRPSGPPPRKDKPRPKRDVA